MTPVEDVISRLSDEVADLSARFGRKVDAVSLGMTDRQGQLPLAEPGRISANGSCRLLQARDGWIALNLAREDDRDLMPAWIGCEPAADPWPAIVDMARQRDLSELVASGVMLGLPVAGVGEIATGAMRPPTLSLGQASAQASRRPSVLDLSALWAGPMCGAVLAEAGAEVTLVNSAGRPDPSAASTPQFYNRLNGLKSKLRLDLRQPADRVRLVEMATAADVLITSARPRALDRLGLAPGPLFARNPSLTWVAITGYGWTGKAADRVAFGDDAAAAGGLVDWDAAGAPKFLGDALSDPVTGLAAAGGALRALASGGGVLIDAAMANCAAGAAAAMRAGAVA